MVKRIQFDHIACGVRKVADCHPFVLRLGGRPRKGGSDAVFSGGQFKFSNGSCLELIAPNVDSQDNFLYRFLSKSGPSIHHITFLVPSLENAVKHAKSLGLSVVGISDKKKHWKEAFLHPKDSLNILTQLAEWNPEYAEEGVAWTPSWSGFDAFNKMVEAEAKSEEKNDTAIVGLRGLRVGINRSNLGKADSIFGQLLSGKIINQSQQSLTYTWEGSPMVLQVEILDPAGAAGVSDGVVGIEYFPREENFEKESQNPPFEPLTGAKMIPVRWTPTSSSRIWNHDEIPEARVAIFGLGVFFTELYGQD